MAREDDDDPVCVICAEGPYLEEEWHLKIYSACANGCCEAEWFHPNCFLKEGICPKEKYTGPKCILCDEGPYLEEVWHLQKIGCCDNGVYHPACTVNLLKEFYGVFYFEPIRCKFCELDPTIENLLKMCSIM